ncbi:MAG: conserved hypothetical phage-related protein [Clostridia bacterium]|jgi:NTP pyrophosphatase (non-canonical NTP hydrolase)|nr:conserved hypothetical phage-related protein [Clostridia bacterium]
MDNILLDNDIIDRAIKHYGERQRINQTIEELGELIVALSKSIRGFANKPHIAEEIADVEIMLHSIKRMLDLDFFVDMEIHHKLERLTEKMKRGEI